MPTENIDWTKLQTAGFVDQLIAIAAADTWPKKTSDLNELINLLQSEAELHAYCRQCIADLLNRHRLNRRPGRPRRPLYWGAQEVPVQTSGARTVPGQVRNVGDLVVCPAVVAADTWPDKQSEPLELIALLRSDIELTGRRRQWIADLFDRHRLFRRPGRPPPPVYGNTVAEGIIAMGAKLVRSFIRDGRSYDDAINAVAIEREQGERPELHGLDIDKLDSAMKGQRGSTRRRRARKHRD